MKKIIISIILIMSILPQQPSFALRPMANNILRSDILSEPGSNADNNISSDGTPIKYYGVGKVQFVPKESALYLNVEEIQKKLEEQLPGLFVMVHHPHISLVTLISREKVPISQDRLDVIVQQDRSKKVDLPGGVLAIPTDLKIDKDVVKIEMRIDGLKDLSKWRELSGDKRKQRSYHVTIAWPKRRLRPEETKVTDEIFLGYKVNMLGNLKVDSPALVYYHDLTLNSMEALHTSTDVSKTVLAPVSYLSERMSLTAATEAAALRPMATADNLDLIECMKQRFNALIQRPAKAPIFDIDGNLTDENSEITEEAIAMIISLRRAGIPVLLITARKYELTSEEKARGGHDLKEVLEKINSHLDPSEKNEILCGLYAASENGAFISNGFLRGEKGYKSYENEVFETLGIKLSKSREDSLKDFLSIFNLKECGLKPIEFTEAKERSFTFIDTREGREERLSALKDKLTVALKEAGLLDNNIIITQSSVSVEVAYYPVDKRAGVVFFNSVLGIKDDEFGFILTSGDNGQKTGNDYTMLAKEGGLSSDKFVADDPYMIALILISGQPPGVATTLWAVRQIKWRLPDGKIIGPLNIFKESDGDGAYANYKAMMAIKNAA